jgi:hypothetical protein
MIHDLKCWPEYFAPLADGRKPFELRLNDRPYAVGDTLLVREYEPVTRSYSGRSVRCLVTCLVAGGPWLAPGYVALGIRVVGE